MSHTCANLLLSRPDKNQYHINLAWKISDQFDSNNLCGSNKEDLNMQKFLMLPGSILRPFE